MTLRATLALLLTLLAAPLAAQEDDAALLVADDLFVEGDERLVAKGNVEILYQQTRLTARSVIYDGAADSLELQGPIRITGPQGEVLLADTAELDQDLENGILTGARLVLDRQLQLAAVEARRAQGRYTELNRVAVSSCQVCGANEVPLWQIRADRVVHDQQERQLYFDNATLRVLDLPVLYVPRLRLPDPTVTRARGVLIPRLRSSTLLGFGVKVPYFIPIGDHQDITLTPYLSRKTKTMEFRYRRAFAHGEIELNGAVSRDTLENNDLRAYLFAEGEFELPRDFDLSFNLKTVQDYGYLSDYGYSSTDRLDSAVELVRARDSGLLRASIVHYESLREDEENDTQPAIVGDIRYERRLFPSGLPGELRLGGTIHSHHRYSSYPLDGPDEDDLVDGRDVARVGLDLSWRERWTLPAGLRAGAQLQLWADRYAIEDDATSDQDASALTPGASVELRWPLLQRSAQGGRTLLEPILQVGWTGGERPNIANDESTRAEFDEGNLLALSRFPAGDRREHGTTLATGLRMLHRAPAGWQTGLTLGRVLHDEEDPAFTRSSGLDGDASDWLLAASFSYPTGLDLMARGLLDGLSFTKAEARAEWQNDRLDLGASYLLLVSDADEGRGDAQSEWTFDGSYRVRRNWTTSAETRYDLADDRLDRFGLGLQYRNECIEVAFSATRRYASSENVEPSTDFGLTVALKGFGTGGSGKEYRRTCPQ